ncbi:damage-inducible protein [Brevundimonas sp.]|uniref:ImuA family protein n=1 Tax=Brevundimonas sp. TaxID=1871086 RepID=UPI001A2755EE|nr:damage-inducible protein [Brevundimonas sp.]MBJ7483496.1 damage-inducible protein [Brevundimonas sp.]
MQSRPVAELAALRARIEGLEAAGRPRAGVLPFGVSSLDAALPQGGLALGALHEVAGGGEGAVDGAAAALFAAGIAARLPGQVLWCVTRPDLFAPALKQVGLDPDRILYLEAGDEKSLLACFEEGLRHGGLGAVVAEVARLSMTASRRLQLAAEGSGVTAIAVRRWRRAAEAADFGQPTAAVTRWRVTPQPSSPLPAPGVGRPRWFVELIRCRAGDCADFSLEACDEEGRLAVPAELANRSVAPAAGRRRAAA